jgi:hypothetical protein
MGCGFLVEQVACEGVFFPLWKENGGWRGRTYSCGYWQRRGTDGEWWWGAYAGGPEMGMVGVGKLRYVGTNLDKYVGSRGEGVTLTSGASAPRRAGVSETASDSSG